jgi:hypothetical protein
MGLFAGLTERKRQIEKLSTVTNSVEFQRIFSLPRRRLDLVYEADGGTLSDVSDYFCRPGSPLRFWPIQSAALVEAAQHDGLFAPIKVGGGKTLVCLALPEVMDAKRAVLLVKPQLRDQLKEEAEGFYGKHFDLPLDRITVVAYSELSSQEGVSILDKIKPDLIIADEAHCLRHRVAARTKRFLRYMREHPECRFCALSGTMTTRSVTDYSHLLELALRKNSPLPRGYSEVRDWAGALDVCPMEVVLPGKLKCFCEGRETPREGYQRRLIETPGVVASDEDDLKVSLVIQRVDPMYPEALQEAYEIASSQWEYNDEVFVDAMTRSRFLRQISMGFYYKWDWPEGEPDYEWLEARKEWNCEVREKLKRPPKGLDSPGLLAKAAAKGTWESTAWAAWAAVKDRPEPPTVTVWVEEFLYKGVFDWIRSIGDYRGIIWYEHNAVGEHVANWCGLPRYGPDEDPREASESIIVASINAHGDGKNLQMFSRQLFLSLPPNGTTVEQAVGRSHRHGQLEDTVEVTWFGHTDVLVEAFGSVIEDARYVEETTGHRQKVLYASKIRREL